MMEIDFKHRNKYRGFIIYYPPNSRITDFNCKFNDIHMSYMIHSDRRLYVAFKKHKSRTQIRDIYPFAFNITPAMIRSVAVKTIKRDGVTLSHGDPTVQTTLTNILVTK